MTSNALRIVALTCLGSSLHACAGSDESVDYQDLNPSPNLNREVIHMDLELDLATQKGVATIELNSDNASGMTFETGDLNLSRVHREGLDIPFASNGLTTHLGIPPESITLTIEYAFSAKRNFDGMIGDNELTFLWPSFCGNLFPCRSRPDDGLTMSLELTGVDSSQKAIYPTLIQTEAPAYMFAFAIGNYQTIDLGRTNAGTNIAAHYLPGQGALDAATRGTAHLKEVFDFFESTLGPYPYGDRVASVAANWGPGAFGGMEHHPFWHVANDSFDDEITHAHEAAHGWFGNGVRISCWEDFVLSEGVVTYLAARALEHAGVDVWPNYACDLQRTCRSQNTIALPDQSCNAIDLINHPLWSNAPYSKGAFLFKEISDLVGQRALDEILSDFFMAHVGSSARMSDLLDVVKEIAETSDAAIAGLEQKWLRELSCPTIDLACSPLR